MCKCTIHAHGFYIWGLMLTMSSVKGRPHYYSYKKEEYAHIKFDLDAGTLTSLHNPILYSTTAMINYLPWL